MDDKFSSVQALARQLGVERRLNARVLYPKRTTGPLPAISFDGQAIKVYDISVGGCCLHDPSEILGKDVGGELRLTLFFRDEAIEVRCRLVGRVDHRRHIQYLNLPPSRSSYLKAVINGAVNGSSLKQTWPPEFDGPALDAREIWSSLAGDSVTLVDDVHRTGQMSIAGMTYTLHKNAWPTDANGDRVPHHRLLALILFLANIPQPTGSIQLLLAELEALSLEEAK